MLEGPRTFSCAVGRSRISSWLPPHCFASELIHAASQEVSKEATAAKGDRCYKLAIGESQKWRRPAASSNG